ncbi:MAG TPA: ribosome rescue protein RqcH [Candidatus Nanoarchaeia archaeon]|nr:ribosome rescue protein RqcH [Candidatus Nanoarchaeia archaeon]
MQTAIDLIYLVRELQVLEGAYYEKTRQTGEDEITLTLHKSGLGKQYLIIRPGEVVYLSSDKQGKEVPTPFTNYLNKHLEQTRITKILQHGFERIIEITFSNNAILLIEILTKGNLLLLEDTIIKACYEEHTWKDRTIKVDETYKYPPLRNDPFTMEDEEFIAVIKNNWQEHGKEFIKTLAADMGLSGKYAEELCERADIKKTASHPDLTKLHKYLFALTCQPINANTVQAKKVIINPILMKIYDLYDKKTYTSYSEALQDHYENKATQVIQGKHEEKYEKLLAEQHTNIQQLEEKSNNYKIIGDQIYEHYTELEELIAAVKKAKWHITHALIKKLEPTTAKVVITLGTNDITLDINKSMHDNATYYYEIAKKSRKKLPKAQAALLTLKAKAEREKPEETSKKRKRKKDWYEKFRWYTSSEGKLVLGGRDATTNDILIKKYVEKDDLVFHTEKPGSPFVVIKTQGKPLTTEEQTEAAQFCATNSKGWGQKTTIADVYSIKPDQIKKQFGLPKGTFMIYGERTYYKPVLQQAVGKTAEGRIMGGPENAIKKHCTIYYLITPGEEKKSDMAKKIKHYLHHDDIDEIMQALPPGEGTIKTP